MPSSCNGESLFFSITIGVQEVNCASGVANTWRDQDWTKATEKALTIIQVRDDTAWN